jgi:hypothetical protein
MPDNEIAEIHTPASLMCIFSNTFRTGAERKILQLRGVYKQTNGKQYGNWYYDRIKSEFDSYTLTLKVSALMRQQLQEDKVYTFNCYLDKAVKETGSIDLSVSIVDIVAKAEQKINEEDLRRFEVVQKKIKKGYRDFDAMVKGMLYLGQKPRISIVYGATGIVDKDFDNAIGEASSRYFIKTVRKSLSDKQGIISELRVTGDEDLTDAIAIVRGGGSGLEIFNDSELAEACINTGAIFISAIGHAVDVTLVEQVADKKFTTPTAFGTHLKKLADEVVEEQSNSKAKLVEDITKTMDEQYLNRINGLAKQVHDNEVKNAQIITDIESKNKERVDLLLKSVEEKNTVKDGLEKSISLVMQQRDDYMKENTDYQLSIQKLASDSVQTKKEMRNMKIAVFVSVAVAVVEAVIYFSK